MLTLSVFALSLISLQNFAQGTWTPVATPAPAASGGVMMLLSDGSAMCKTNAGGGDGIGNTYYKLTPDINGSYVNGTWTALKPMNSTRLYYSSQVLQDGRVYVAGGEYGTGGSLGETYNPLTNIWTAAPPQGSFISDANSAILPDGRVMQALVTGTLKPTKFFDPVANTYTTGPNCLGIHNESTWVKLPDESILMVDRNATSSERYIPALGIWVADATVPVSLYDPYGLETGAGVLLPNGRAFFIGSTGHTAYYTPSGNTSPGSWAAGPDFPNGQGAPDAPASMMVDGKVLCAVSPKPTSGNHFPTPTSYYEFDYLTNSYTQVNAPAGGLTSNVSVYVTNMLTLPDGKVLFSFQGNATYYVYTPAGAPIAAGAPTLITAKKVKGTKNFQLTGKLFNGISEGTAYGDDWQMATNYPLVRLTSGTNVYYGRTSNWNSTGVSRGNKADTATLTLPAGLPSGTYSLVVVANGFSSNALTLRKRGPSPFDAVIADAAAEDISASVVTTAAVYPNPAKSSTNIQFTLAATTNVSLKVVDMSGKELIAVLNGNVQQGYHSTPVNTSSLKPGVYLVRMVTGSSVKTMKLVIQ